MEWEPVSGSSRVLAVAYDALQETIYVRFQDGIEWWYGNCPLNVWDEFTAPATSKGRFIKDVLDDHPKGKYVG